jgi:hypothetical protein
MDNNASETKGERREKKNRAKMAVSGRNIKRLVGHIIQRKPIDRPKGS